MLMTDSVPILSCLLIELTITRATLCRYGD